MIYLAVDWGVIHPYLADKGYVGLCMDKLKNGYLKLVKQGEETETNILGKGKQFRIQGENMREPQSLAKVNI